MQSIIILITIRMKRFLSVALSIVCLSGCGKLSEELASICENDLSTKAAAGNKDFSVMKAYTVSLSDIQNYVRHKTEAAREEGKDLVVKNVSPLFEDHESGFTPLYLINYGDGWDVISGDKRIPPVLASKEKGYLDLSGRGDGGLQDDIWFTDSDAWTASGHSYQYNRKMLAGFQQIN